jgi:cytochrome P450
MQEVTLRIVGRTLFSTDVGEDLDVIRRAAVVLSEHFRSRLFTLMTLLPDAFPTPGNLRYQSALRDLNRLVVRIIGQRRATGQAGTDLLGMLLAARDERGSGMTDQQLRDEVLTLLLAGHDTTSLALTWAFVLLAHHPGVDARLQAELGSVLGGRRPSASDASALQYVDHVVTETLRLYPTAWAITREALRDSVIGGHPVRKGTTVVIVPWVIHRDPRFFVDPLAFQPARWANGVAERLPRFAYLPFGGGQRVCIGSGFAQLEATLLLASIAQRYRLEVIEGVRGLEPWPVVTLRTRRDVPMRLIGREAQ